MKLKKDVNKENLFVKYSKSMKVVKIITKLSYKEYNNVAM